MITERVVGTFLLAMGIVFALSLSFIPVGDAWVQDTDTRTTEIYGMFTKVREVTASGEEATGNGATWYYVDPGLDKAGGIDYLRGMGLLLGLSMLFGIVALLLTTLPRVSPTRAGGMVALPAAALFLGAIVLAVLGTQLHAYYLVGSAAQFNFNTAGAIVAVLGILSLGIGTGLGLSRTKATRAAEPQTWETPAPVAAGPFNEQAAWSGEESTLAGDDPTQDGWTEETPRGWDRRLRCPDCSTVVGIGFGVVPICPTCDFGADYNGPAAPPVPAQAVPG